MRPDEAGELFALLPANYPRTKITDDTARLWLDALGRLDRHLGETAVRSLIASAKFWPSLADLHEHIAIVREQAARERREAERRDAEREYDDMPRPPLRDMPEVVAFLERFASTSLALERGADGPCDDCHTERERCRVGRVFVCASCAELRLNAGARLVDVDNDAADTAAGRSTA